MAYTSKVWKDRIVQYLNRRRLTDVDTGDIQTVTVARDEGGITEEGDIFNAATMNDLEDRIDDAFTEVNDKLSDFSNELFKIVNYTSESITLPAGGAMNVTGNMMGMTEYPAGYKPIAVSRWYASANGVFARSLEISSLGAASVCVLRSVESSTVTVTYQLGILYIKADYYPS